MSIEITDEMVDAFKTGQFSATLLSDPRAFDTIRAGLVYVAPLIEAQAREKALREAAEEARKMSADPDWDGLARAGAADVRDAILALIGAPQQNTQSGASGVQSESES